MHREDALEGRFEKRLWFRPVFHAAEINDDGLMLGAGTVLARMGRDAFGAPALALAEDQDRLLALLAAAYDQPVSPNVLPHLKGASDHWRRGEKALANIRLAFAQLPRLEDRAGAFRLFLAEELLDRGLSPQALTKALGLDAPRGDLGKYDPNQPRVAAGNGRESGRWASSGTGAGDAAPPTNALAAAGAVAVRAASASGTLAEGLFAPRAGGAFLTGLGALATTIGAGFVLGAIFVPSPNRVVSEGAIPGESDLRYSFNGDEGALRLFRQGVAGRDIVAEARLGRDGIFFESETGLPIARFVGGSLVFDAASLADVTEEQPAHAGAAASARARSRKNGPQLCPDPTPDVPHGATQRAWAYQEQISALNNPQRPLKRGEAVSLYNPKTGKFVVFDDCRERDGTMIEAKGPGYADELKKGAFFEDILSRDWQDQAARQVAASGSRDIEWRFAEPEAKAFAQKVLSKDEERFGKITLLHVPAIKTTNDPEEGP